MGFFCIEEQEVGGRGVGGASELSVRSIKVHHDFVRQRSILFWRRSKLEISARAVFTAWCSNNNTDDGFF